MNYATSHDIFNQSFSINRSDMPKSALMLEREKSNLILQANLLQSQGEHETSTDRFAEVVILEARLATEL